MQDCSTWHLWVKLPERHLNAYLDLLSSSCHAPVPGYTGLGSDDMYQTTVKCVCNVQHKCIQRLRTCIWHSEEKAVRLKRARQVLLAL